MTVTQRVSHLVEQYKLNPVFATRAATELKDLSPESVAQLLKKKPKPFVKWVGGKRQLISQFHGLGALSPKGFDQNENTYFEPFVGGGAIFFEILPLKAWINDINPELVTTYNVIRDEVDHLISELNNGSYIYDKEVFYFIRSLDTSKLSHIKRAARFIYLNRTAFNGLYRVNKSGHFNVPFGRYSNPQIVDEENLRNVSAALKNTIITNNSYKFVLDKAKKNDFVYFDPPYYPASKTASFTAYASGEFLEKEQIELKDVFLELHKRGCHVSLSNSDTPFVEGLFKPHVNEGVFIHKVQAGRSINSNYNKRGKISEILVTNIK
jgi:DNA adenine methylase